MMVVLVSLWLEEGEADGEDEGECEGEGEAETLRGK